MVILLVFLLTKLPLAVIVTVPPDSLILLAVSLIVSVPAANVSVFVVYGIISPYPKASYNTGAK